MTNPSCHRWARPNWLIPSVKSRSVRAASDLLKMTAGSVECEEHIRFPCYQLTSQLWSNHLPTPLPKQCVPYASKQTISNLAREKCNLVPQGLGVGKNMHKKTYFMCLCQMSMMSIIHRTIAGAPVTTVGPSWVIPPTSLFHPLLPSSPQVTIIQNHTYNFIWSQNNLTTYYSKSVSKNFKKIQSSPLKIPSAKRQKGGRDTRVNDKSPLIPWQPSSLKTLLTCSTAATVTGSRDVIRDFS